MPILCFYVSLGSNTPYLLAGTISIYDYMVNLFVYNNENKIFHSPLDEYMSVVYTCPIDSFNVQEFVLYQAIMQIAGMIISIL